jgi:Transglutaminase-like superfamily
MIVTAVRLLFTRPARAFLLLRMSFWVVLFSFAVRLLSLPKALALVSTEASTTKDAENNEDLATAIDALLALKIFVFSPICWKRAAILHRYLALRGVTNSIKFGIRKGPDSKLNGHAWLEVDGSPVFEAELPNYTVTYSFPSDAPFEMELSAIARNTV